RRLSRPWCLGETDRELDVDLSLLSRRLLLSLESSRLRSLSLRLRFPSSSSSLRLFLSLPSSWCVDLRSPSLSLCFFSFFSTLIPAWPSSRLRFDGSFSSSSYVACSCL